MQINLYLKSSRLREAEQTIAYITENYWDNTKWKNTGKRAIFVDVIVHILPQ